MSLSPAISQIAVFPYVVNHGCSCTPLQGKRLSCCCVGNSLQLLVHMILIHWPCRCLFCLHSKNMGCQETTLCHCSGRDLRFCFIDVVSAGGGLLPPTPPNAPYQPMPGSSDAGSSSSSTTFAYLPSGSPQLPFAFTPSPQSLPSLAGQVCFLLLFG